MSRCCGAIKVHSCECGRKLSGLSVSLVLQEIDDVSIAGLKNLLLGDIHRCLGNIKDAIEVLSHHLIDMY